MTGSYFAWSAVDTDPDRARATALATLAEVYGQDMTRIADAAIPTGTPDQVAGRLADYRDAGAEHVVLVPACGPDQHEAMIDLMATEVLPALR